MMGIAIRKNKAESSTGSKVNLIELGLREESYLLLSNTYLNISDYEPTDMNLFEISQELITDLSPCRLTTDTFRLLYGPFSLQRVESCGGDFPDLLVLMSSEGWVKIPIFETFLILNDCFVPYWTASLDIESFTGQMDRKNKECEVRPLLELPFPMSRQVLDMVLQYYHDYGTRTTTYTFERVRDELSLPIPDSDQEKNGGVAPEYTIPEREDQVLGLQQYLIAQEATDTARQRNEVVDRIANMVEGEGVENLRRAARQRRDEVDLQEEADVDYTEPTTERQNRGGENDEDRELVDF